MPDRFVDAALTQGPCLDHSSALRRRDYLERVVIGGFPEAVRRTPQRRTAFFDSYLSALIERDVLELATIDDAESCTSCSHSWPHVPMACWYRAPSPGSRASRGRHSCVT